MIINYKILSILLFLFFVTSCSVQKNEEIKKPNIVIILADDMGYGDVKAFNKNSSIPTPNLDELAKEGVSFTDAHTPSSVCTPTRYGLITGRYCWRTRLKKGVLRGYDKPLIENDRPTIASYLKSNGYNTGVVGKWHLGLGFKQIGKRKFKKQYDLTETLSDSPNDLGFDYSYVLPASLDFQPYVYVRNKNVTDKKFVDISRSSFPEFWRKGIKSKDFDFYGVLDNFLGEAESFIRREAKKEDPFFLYFPMTAPHTPLVPTDPFKGKSGMGVYGDFITQVDWTAGEILKLLKELNIDENTIVIFTSDNGSPMVRYDVPQEYDHTTQDTLQYYNRSNHMSNYIFSGVKGDVLEGGHRVPFVVRWPKKFHPKVIKNTTICLTDVFETITDIIGNKKPDGSAEDSYSFLPLLTGEKESVNRPAVIHHSGKGMFAIRKGDFKLILGNGSGARTEPIGVPFGEPYQLFNLHNDIEEKDNLIGSKLKTVESLEKDFYEIKNNSKNE